MLTGLSVYLIPQEFSTAIYGPLLPYFPYLAAFLMAASVVLLIMARYKGPVWVQRLLPLYPASVLLFFALKISQAGGLSGAIVYSFLAMALLLLPWLREGVVRVGGAQLDLFHLTTSAVFVVVGLAMILLPGRFASPGFAPIHGSLPQVGLLALLGAALLRLPELRRRQNDWWDGLGRVVAALFPALMVATFWQSGAWSGVVLWLPLTAGVLAGPVRPRFMRWHESITAPPAPGELSHTRLERFLEGWVWLLAIIAVSITTLPGVMLVSSPERFHLFVGAVAIYNFAAHWLLPNLGRSELRNFAHLAVLALALGLLVIPEGPTGQAFLAILVVMPTLAVRVLGVRFGTGILVLVVVVLLLNGLEAWLLTGIPAWQAAGSTAVRLIVLAAATAVGIGTVLQQRRLVQELATQHTELQTAHQNLQLQEEELQAQQEEMQAQHEAMQAQHEELVEQSHLLMTQKEQLLDALARVQAADEERGRLVTTLEATTDFVAIADRSGHGLYFNKAGREILGLEPGVDASSMHVFDCFPPRLRRFARREITLALLRDSLWTGESALSSLTGEETPVSLVVVGHRTPDGELAYVSAVARNIRDRKEAERALRQSEERFRASFDSAPIGMVLMDLNLQVIQVNRAFLEMVGYSAQEMQALGIQGTTFPEDYPEEPVNLIRILSGEIDTFRFEKRYVHKQGQLVWADVSVALIRHPDGSAAHLLSHVSDITQRKRSESQLVHMANYDSLTNLFNRRRFQEELELQLEGARIRSERGAVLLLDLDQFKYVNDTLGHQAGDLLLRGLADVLKGVTGQGQMVSRLGGDEFAMLLPGADARIAERVAMRTLRAVQDHVQVIQGHPLGITASIGIALFPQQGSTVEEVLSRADLALYQAKEGGRNNYCIYADSSSKLAEMDAKLNWERRIREALEHNRFVLHCQPIIEVATGRITQYELLLRMLGEEGQLIYPRSFLDVAERFGLIHAIDRWVVGQAIALIARYQAAGQELCLEVNLSGKAFSDALLLPMIRRSLEQTSINPASLVLEITETAAITDVSVARQFVETLKELGCRFALDDFGAGFSSLFYLKHLPVDYLKIDGSFIHNLPDSPVDQHLVKAMVEVARGLGMQTVAEFVSDDATVALLRRLGVDCAQGYHIGMPGGLEMIPGAPRAGD